MEHAICICLLEVDQWIIEMSLLLKSFCFSLYEGKVKGRGINKYSSILEEEDDIQ